MRIYLPFLWITILLTSLIIVGCSDNGSDPTGPSNVQNPPPPPTTQSVSFQSQVKPIFQRHGCNGCHGGSGGLFVQTVAQLLQGGGHGPAVVAGNANESILIKKLLPNPPFGDRMPQGGPFLPDSSLQVLRDWINQGAKEN